MGAAFGSAGERCMAVSVAVAVGNIGDQLVNRIHDNIHKLKISPWTDKDSDMGPLISKEHLEKVRNYIDIGVKEGASLVADGRNLQLQGYENGYFIGPSLFDNVTKNMSIYKEEIFGPVVAIIEYETFDEMMDIVNGTRYGLSAAIYTKDVNESFRFMKDVETGLAYVNTSCIGAEVGQNFGGIKDTSPISSREAGSQMFDAVTYVKNMVVDFSGKLQKAQIE